MFRKPRGDDFESKNPQLGRPPTPPLTPTRTLRATTPTMAASKTKTPAKQTPLPVIGRQGPTGRKPAASAKLKQSGKPNSSILSFFKKSDDNQQMSDGLFVQSSRFTSTVVNTYTSPTRDVDCSEEPNDSRFNEIYGSFKKRRTSRGEERHGDSNTLFSASPCKPSQPNRGPFLEDSESEADEEELKPIPACEVSNLFNSVAGLQESEHVHTLDVDGGLEACRPIKPESDSLGTRDQAPPDEINPRSRPPLIKEETSFGPDAEDFRDFDDDEEFDEDLFEGGDEFQERIFMEEQERLDTEQVHEPSCPICLGSMVGMSEQDAGVHVNACLDGTPSTLTKVKSESEPVCSANEANPNTRSTIKQSTPGAQFKRTPRPAKPGQASPFIFGQASVDGKSAFSQLMSGHAEDAAWAEAAAAEHAARGKPAYQRTCPFYKILPGLYICVDAFRYGAVAGCQAYFLSHFHSDHYVGLTSTWSHGPIYCSRITGNLVRQQLRVDPKYVIDLEFEQPVEVPGTKGVMVTMISANHCPGSSLYLFEKDVFKRPNGEIKKQRILHCGDFRACRKHIEHPLLMPNVQDKITGKTRDQKIDVCYLDTTYLNPKYAFPSQELVIKACADMCVSLSKHTVDEDDGWEQMKRQRAGEGMVKFVRHESTDQVKIETNDDDEGLAAHIKLEENPHASQQIISSTNAQRTRGRLLVIVGTYSIGKERICLGIARALNSKIYAPPSKLRIVAALEDPELNERMTSDPRAAQVHMTPLFEIRAETLDDYLKDYFPHFTRAVGFRPSGWNYRPPNTRFLESPAVQTVLNGENWKSIFSMRDLVPQRGSTSRASCFGVPYSEHSSFRELTMFCCALRIDKIIPTVNIGSAKSREKMKAWCERWAQERKKNGLWKLPDDGSW